jgi:tetratricopeptide (TPR) repeat protein
LERYTGLKFDPQTPVMRCLSWLMRDIALLTTIYESNRDKQVFNYDSEIFDDHRVLEAEPLVEFHVYSDDVDLFIHHEYKVQRNMNLETRQEALRQDANLMKKQFPDSPLLCFILKDTLGSFRPYFSQDEAYVEPRLFEAQLLLSQGKRSRAEKLYQAVLGQCADIPDVYRGLGLINLAYDNHARAMEYFHQVLMKIPRDYESLFGMGAAQLYTQQYEESLATFSIIVDQNLPYQGEARYYKALNAFHLFRLGDALTHLSEAKAYVADLPDLWELEGIIHFQENRLDEARLCLEKAVELGMQKRSYPAISTFYLGLIATKKQQKGDAWTHFERAAWLDLADIERLVASLQSIDEKDEENRQEKMIRRRIARGLGEVRSRLKVSEPLMKGCPKSLREKWTRTLDLLNQLEIDWGKGEAS